VQGDGRGTFCFFRDEMAQTARRAALWSWTSQGPLANEEFSCSISRSSISSRGESRLAKRCCDGIIRCGHGFPVDIIPAPRTWLIVELAAGSCRKAHECMKWPEGVSVARHFSPQHLSA